MVIDRVEVGEGQLFSRVHELQKASCNIVFALQGESLVTHGVTEPRLPDQPGSRSFAVAHMGENGPAVYTDIRAIRGTAAITRSETENL